MANDLNIRIKINSDTKQLEITQDGFEKISGSVKKTAGEIQNFDSKLDKSIDTVKDFAIAYISLNTAMAAGKYFVENADALNRLDGRLKLATDSTAEFRSQQKELLAIAKETHNPLQNITDLYIKLDPALSRLGATTDTTNQVTENFAKGLKLGGANAIESSSAILQFAQAMGSGVLRGDEFNSMAEASPKLMEYLAKGLKVPQGELRNMAEAGELTAGKVSAALLTMTDEIERDFKHIPRVVGDAAVDFKTEASVVVQEIDKATGATAALADGIDAAAALISNKNGVLDEFTDTVMTAGIAVASVGIGLGTAKVAISAYSSVTAIATAGQIGFTAAIISGTIATKAKEAAVIALRLAMNAIPLVAIATGVALIASHFITAARNANLLSDALAKTNDELQAMTKNQLAAQRAIVQGGVQEKLNELQDAGLEYRHAKQRGADKQELSALKAHYDDLSDEYKRLTDQRAAIDAAANNTKSDKPKNDENEALKKQIEELLKNGGKTDKPKKGKSEAEKLADDIAKAKLDALVHSAEQEAALALSIYQAKLDAAEYNAEQEAALALSVYQAELDAAQFNIDQITQMHIDAYNAQEQAAIDSYERQAQAAIRIFETSQSEVDKINADNLSVWESAGEFFDDTQMNDFFKKWQDSIDGVKGGYNEISDVIGDYGATSKNWTAGLTGQAKSVANIGNALADVFEDQRKYDKLREKINASTMTDEEKKVKLLELEGKHTNAQIGAYSNLAGAAAGFFEEGSKGAKAMQAVSSALGIAQGVQAIISAWGSAPFPLNMPAVAATTAAVAPLVAQLGGTLGGGGGGNGGDYSSFSKSEMIDREYAPMLNRIDKQIELLESIKRNGSASALNVAKSSVEFDKSLRLLIEESMKKVRDGGTLDVKVTSAQAAAIEGATGSDIYSGKKLNKNTLRDMETFLDFASAATKDLGYFAGKKDYEREISRDTFITNVQEVIADFAIGMSESVAKMTDAKDAFKSYFDDITGTTTYASIALSDAFDDVNRIIGNKDLPTYLETHINAITAVEEAFGGNIVNILNMSNDFATQVEATQMLNNMLGTTFEAGTEDALNYIESIQLVSEAMATSRNNIADWAANFKSESQIAAEQAAKLGENGVKLATSTDELSRLFARLATDADGLTDAELDVLNANRDLIESYTSVATDIDKAITSIVGAKNTTLSDAASMIGGASIDNYDEIVNTIKSAYDYEKSLMTEKHTAEIKQLDDMKSTLGDLKKFSDGLLAANRVTAIPDQYAGRYLDKSINEYQNALRTGGDASGALASIKSTSGDYINYLKTTSATDADYNFGVASLANKLKSIGGNEATLSTIDKSISGLNSTFDASVAALKNDTVNMLGQLDTTMNDQLSALDTISAATDAQTQQIVDLLTGAGIKLADGWQPTADYEEYAKIIGMYAERDLLTAQSDQSGIDYWANALQTATADAVAKAMDAALAQQAVDMTPTNEAINAVATATNAESNAVSGLSVATYGLGTGTKSVYDSILELSGATATFGTTVSSDIGLSTGAISSFSTASETALGGIATATGTAGTTVSDALGLSTGAISSFSTASETALGGIATATGTAGTTVSNAIDATALSNNTATETQTDDLNESIADGTGSVVDQLTDASTDMINAIYGAASKIVAANNLTYLSNITQTTTLSGSIAAASASIRTAIGEIDNGTQSVGEYLTSLYTDGLGRTPDAAGYAYWMDQVSSGAIDTADLMSTFANASAQNGQRFDISKIRLTSLSDGDMLSELKALRREVEALKNQLSSINDNASKIVDNTSGRWKTA